MKANFLIYLTFIISIVSIISMSKKKKNFKKKSPKPIFNGITFVGDKYCPQVSYEDPLSKESMKKLKETGANWVAVVVTEYQDKIDSTDIYPLYEGNYIENEYYVYKTESIKGLSSIIDYAHSIGLKVMLKPHIDLAKEDQYNQVWRGDIGKGITDQEEWVKWFNSYEIFILKYARLAELLNVEMFSVSCELINTSQMEFFWRKIVQSIRNVYSGLLTDSANHDGEEYDKAWWDVLDYIGVDAYYLPIQTPEMENFQKNLDSAFDNTLKKLRRLSEKFKKDVIITEIGFCSGNCRIGDRYHPPNLTDHYLQAYFYERFINTFSKQKFIRGFFWWAWNSDPYYGGSDDNCISPQHKPAEYILRKYYGGDTKVNYKPDQPARCPCTI
jgi:hypothetical protein